MCFYQGNEDENNCTSCINYYYYFSLYNDYSCTNNFQCPEEAKLLNYLKFQNYKLLKKKTFNYYFYL